MPEADPAERVVDRREPGTHPTAPLQLGLDGQREIGRPLDQPPQVGLVRLEQGRRDRRSDRARRSRSPAPVDSLIAADGLTANRRAALRIELPPSTARTIRSRRSMDIGAGMTTSRLSQPILSNHRHRFHAIGICSSPDRLLAGGRGAAGPAAVAAAPARPPPPPRPPRAS